MTAGFRLGKLFNYIRDTIHWMDSMMKCRNVQKKLSAYQDRELKPREQEEVSRHLLELPVLS